jgi:BirA family biotin operon repressor/biotin-[acetyl-CoA-carboxylase] ligase
MTENRERSIVIGQDVQVIRGGTSFPARALDIDDQGRLVIRTEEGVTRVNSGEVSLKL